MKSKIFLRQFLGLLTAVLVSFTFISGALAAEMYFAENVTINSDQLIPDNLITSGGRVVINGTIDGDLIVAGGMVDINGEIKGDVIAAGGQISIGPNAIIASDVQATGGTITIEGKVAENVDIIGGNFQLTGSIGRNLKLSVGDVEIDGQVGENVDIDANSIRLGKNAEITGNLKYVDKTEPRIDEKATIGGQIQKEAYTKSAVTQKTEKEYLGFLTVSEILSSIASFFGSLVIGILLVLIAPNLSQRVTTKFQDNFWWNLLIGLVSLATVFIAFILLLISIAGIPLAIIGLVGFIIVMYLSHIFVSYWLGCKIFQHEKIKDSKKKTWYSVFAIAIGLLIYKLVILIPWIGNLISFIVLFGGIGAILASKKDFLVDARKKKII